jgi:hypothetical protein
MERESFESPELAALLNANFVPVKVPPPAGKNKNALDDASLVTPSSPAVSSSPLPHLLCRLTRRSGRTLTGCTCSTCKPPRAGAGGP